MFLFLKKAAKFIPFIYTRALISFFNKFGLPVFLFPESAA